MPERVAIVTGAGQGIGRGIAERFLAEGLAVVIAEQNAAAGRKAERELHSIGEAIFIQTDVSREPSVKRLIDRVKRRWGRFDVLVNNAGITDPKLNRDVRRWRQVIETNLTGPFLCARYAIPLLKQAKGSIINIASTRAFMSEPNTEAYAASKGGLVALTHALAITCGPDVRVNCISPGWIDTQGEKLRPVDHHQHPVGRVGRVEDIAALALFLISPEAGFITGQNVIADGGMTKKMIYAQ
jgi:NAD(P)-dependent dehydrogenase (short-subunit alcohol dehydrogenase family)